MTETGQAPADRADPYVRVTEHGGVPVVQLGGDHDLATVGAVRHSLDQARRAGGSFAVDLSEVTFLDTTTVHALMGALRAQRDAGLDMTFICPSPAVARVLEMTGLALPAATPAADLGDA
jgi:anti-sigma B factor antagonist